MDAHLYTLRIDPDGTTSPSTAGPNREALAGGRLPEGPRATARFDTLVHPEDRARRARR